MLCIEPAQSGAELVQCGRLISFGHSQNEGVKKKATSKDILACGIMEGGRGRASFLYELGDGLPCRIPFREGSFLSLTFTCSQSVLCFREKFFILPMASAPSMQKGSKEAGTLLSTPAGE